MDDDPPPDNDLLVPATRCGHEQEPVVVDIAHHKGDFIAVPIEQHPHLALRITYSNHRAQPVGGDLVSVTVEALFVEALDTLLVTRAAVGFNELFEEVKLFVLHSRAFAPHNARPYSLQRNIAVFSLGRLDSFTVQRLECIDQSFAGFLGLNDVLNVTA